VRGGGLDTLLTRPPEDPLIPLPTPNQDVPELLKATLNVVVAGGQSLDDPEDLTRSYELSKRLVHTPKSGQTDLWCLTAPLNSCYPSP
jgi:hypothetical protein